jgi:hypothetical protein
MKEYQVFPIYNYRSGFNEALEPWLLPRDAFQVMINAHLYRGVLEKILGYSLYANFCNRTIEATTQSPDGARTTFTGTLSHLPTTENIIVYAEHVFGSSKYTMTYTSDGTAPIINLGTIPSGLYGTINVSTGAYSLTFPTAPPGGTYGVVYIAYDYYPTSLTAIMGIKQYYQVSGGRDVLVFDEKRVGKVIPITSAVLSNQLQITQNIEELQHDYFQSAIITGDGATVVFSGTLAGAPFLPGTLKWTQFNSTGTVNGNPVTDNGFGSLTGASVTSGSVNYVTGAYTITFSAAPANGNYFDSQFITYGDLFTGTFSNFFSLCNYQDYAFFTNSVDPIMYYDGTTVHFLNTNISSAAAVMTYTNGKPTYYIRSCLHVIINRERLLLINVNANGVIQDNYIWWSTPGFPLNFTNNEQLPAPTSEPIVAIGFINTDLVVRFANSERVFRYTEDTVSPFRWDSTNNTWSCDAPYCTINYNSWISTVGKYAIVGSDGVNVKRVDDQIPDFTDPYALALQIPVPYLNQNSIGQCYGERFDDIKEGWLCYNSLPLSQSVVTASDNVLAFNYLDNTYAIYQFPFSCLGYGSVVNVPTWGTIYDTWSSIDDTWGSYEISKNSRIDLAGDQFDKVYQLNDGNTMGDDTTPVLMNAISKNFNPFIEQGQLCRFGFIEILVTANATSTLRVQFYLNDEMYIDNTGAYAGFYQESTIIFTPTDAMSSQMQTKVWKRIYVGAVGKSHTIRFYQNAADFAGGNLNQPIYIHGFNLHMKPAGRIFN